MIAKPGDTVLIDYVLRRSNGYFIYATQEGVSFQPKVGDVPHSHQSAQSRAVGHHILAQIR